jgi:hypothetical protein
MVQHYGFHIAYEVAAILALFPIPYFLFAEESLSAQVGDPLDPWSS